MSSKIYEIPDYLRNFRNSKYELGAGLQWPLGGGYDYLQIDITKFTKVTDLQFAPTSSTATNGKTGATPAPAQSGVSTSGGTTDSIVDTFNASTGLSNIQSRLSIDEIKEDTVVLPVPDNVTYTDGPQYTDNEGIMSKILPSLAKDIANGADATSIASTVQAGAAAGKVGVAMSALGKLAGNAGAAAITQNGFGKVMNPYTEQVFTGVDMRSFSFDWKLVPRNDSETISIQRIIKTLRAAALPDYASKLGLKESESTEDSGNISDRWLTVPKIFRLAWKNGSTNTEIESLPRIKPCILQSVSVVYTPDNVWATYEGANPVAYQLTLSFKETEIITATEVKELNF